MILELLWHKSTTSGLPLSPASSRATDMDVTVLTGRWHCAQDDCPNGLQQDRKPKHSGRLNSSKLLMACSGCRRLYRDWINSKLDQVTRSAHLDAEPAWMQCSSDMNKARVNGDRLLDVMQWSTGIYVVTAISEAMSISQDESGLIRPIKRTEVGAEQWDLWKH